MTQRESNSDSHGAYGSIGCGIVIFFLVVIGLDRCSQPREITEEELQAREEAAAQKAEDRIKGFHCLSDWDGSNVSLVKSVKARLRDPDSFQHVDTLITPVSDETDKHGVSMTYRARNGFGGLNLSRAVGEVDPNSCQVSNVVLSD